DWSAQQSLLTKLRSLAEDARDYEQDTGAHVLHVGFPLLSLPPGAGKLSSAQGGSKRLLAPIAFIPVSLEVRAGVHPVIVIEGLNDGADFLVPNEALFAWLERQTGQRILPDLNPVQVRPDLDQTGPEVDGSADANTADTSREAIESRAVARTMSPLEE